MPTQLKSSFEDAQLVMLLLQKDRQTERQIERDSITKKFHKELFVLSENHEWKKKSTEMNTMTELFERKVKSKKENDLRQTVKKIMKEKENECVGMRVRE